MPTSLADLAHALTRELDSLEARLAEARRELEALVPLPVHWRAVPCGKEGCRRCPHGPYPYLRVKEGGRWRWRYLGKDWTPPEGFIPAGRYRRLLARYHALLRRKVALLERLKKAEAILRGE
ncbi:hypothetical protein [Thermus thalpophilus]|uniref:hypothetical protein n=1 Tax=Thermus thalpophilus TaxID=2908147 RepID=UPI001FAA4753